MSISDKRVREAVESNFGVSDVLSSIIRPISERPYSITVFSESRTKQSFAAECDINNVVARVMQTGQMPTPPVGVYADMTKLPRDLRHALEIGLAGQRALAMLPEKLRPLFLEDPQGTLAAIEKALPELKKAHEEDVAARETAAEVARIVKRDEAVEAAKAAKAPKEAGKPSPT